MPIAGSWGLRMLLLGIDSQFAYIEAVATVLMDAGIGEKWPRPLLSGAVPSVKLAKRPGELFGGKVWKMSAGWWFGTAPRLKSIPVFGGPIIQKFE